MSDPKDYKPFGSYGPKEESESSQESSPVDTEFSNDFREQDDINQTVESVSSADKHEGPPTPSMDDQIRTVVRKMAGDMTFVGIVNVLLGAFVSLSVIGAIFGIPMIVYSVRMIQSGSDYKRFCRSGNIEDLFEAFLNQRKSFFTQKVLLLITIGLIVLQIVLVYLFFDLFVGDLLQEYPFPIS